MIIAVDFDGTCVTHNYPEVGRDIGAQKVLKKIIKSGHDIILYTMRSGQHLEDAKNWFYKNDIKLHAVNINPTQKDWTDSNKCYAQLYIDDAALGAPLVTCEEIRPYIHWPSVEEMLEKRGIIK